MGILDLLPSGIFGYISIFFCVYVGYTILNPTKVDTAEIPNNNDHDDDDDDEDDEPPRNFTAKQLLHFDGKEEPKTEEIKPVYLSLNGTVFDVSKGRDFYGPGGPYELFAGRECGVALAKMSFDAEFLDDMDAIDDLNYGEKDELDNWMHKFEHYRCYPIKGRLVPEKRLPDPDRVLTLEELWENRGCQAVPEGYAVSPIYIGAQDKVYDMSFGGVSFYGEGCSYNVFAGRNAARSLATMSLDPDDAKNPDISDLREKQIKTLNDWKKTFEQRKLYPIVGRLG